MLFVNYYWTLDLITTSEDSQKKKYYLGSIYIYKYLECQTCAKWIEMWSAVDLVKQNLITKPIFKTNWEANKFQASFSSTNLSFVSWYHYDYISPNGVQYN
jgi:hypothetical protein